MCRQFAHPFIQPAHILHHPVNLSLDQPGFFMHAGITQNGAYRMQYQHQIIGARHIDAAFAAFINQPWQLQIDFGIDGFRRQKHDRAVCCFAGHNIALGNIGNMFFDIAFKRPARAFTRCLISGFSQPAIGLQRKF